MVTKTKVCKYCSKDFRWQFGQGKGIFCSRSCHYSYRRGKPSGATGKTWQTAARIDVVCPTCSEVFNIKESALSKRKYCSRKCSYKGHSGESHHAWKGRVYDKNGYILINISSHPNSNPNGYVREHRLVVEEYIGRLLERDEVVHHINGIRDDNRIENLQLYSSNKLHMKDEYRRGKLTGINQGKSI